MSGKDIFGGRGEMVGDQAAASAHPPGMSSSEAHTGLLIKGSEGTEPTAVAVSDAAGRSASTKRRAMSRWTLYRRRFLRNRLAVVGLAIFLVLVVFSAFGKFIAQWDFTELDFLALSAPPSSKHWFGTTTAGNDLFAQSIHGLQRSLIIAVAVSVGTTVISAVLGAAAALYGGSVEKVTLAVIHFMLAIPSFLMIALIVGDSGGDWKMLVVVLIVFGWVGSARVIWALSLSVKENDYVRAARYMGVGNLRTVVRHIIPNIGSLLVIQFTLSVVSTVMSETALSFLGLGVQLPDVSLGTLLSGGVNNLQSAPWQFYFPAAILTLLTVSMAFIADGLRDALDPNSNAGGHA